MRLFAAKDTPSGFAMTDRCSTLVRSSCHSERMGRGLPVSIAMLLCLVVSSCGGGETNGAASPTSRGSPTPSKPAVTGEPPAGIALKKRAGPISWAGAGDGSLLLAYEAPGRCYFRRVMPDRTVVGWFSERGTFCPYLFGFDTGFIGVDSENPMRRSQDLSATLLPTLPSRDRSSDGSGRGARRGRHTRRYPEAKQTA